MKTLKITLIAILSGIALVLITMLTVCLSGGSIRIGNFFFSPESFENNNSWSAGGTVYPECSLVLEQEIPAEGINSLNINYSMNSNDVIFREGAEGTITIREYMNFTPNANQISTINQKNGELTVTGKNRNRFYFFSLPGQLGYTEIFLPPNLAVSLKVRTVSGDIFSDIAFPQCAHFNVSSTSGDIYFPSAAADDLQASSTSGDVHIQEAAGNRIQLSTTSGDLQMENADADQIQVSTTSGDISCGQLSGQISMSSTSGGIRILDGAGSTKVNSVSGDITLSNISGDFQLNTTSGEISLVEGSGCGRANSISGDVCIFLKELTGNLDISTTSGGISLTLPEDASFYLDFDSTSGECNTFFDDDLSFNKRGTQAEGQYGSNGSTRLKISTVSGDLRISKY
ncbi:MAG: DUF4097 domain-containing protein [Acetatifactor sp.]|nr:DUF4097 domain-containing protein [Acetatifactor sp.]